ncbi:MAG: galactose mutarotase, partial [Acidobacteriaceae bacterium]|nr:galactose mutarotase [Acidobacteriaceae bacterium]
MNRIACQLLSIAGLLSCAQFCQAQNRASWGKHDGKDVYLYTLKNASGMEVKITNYGGTVTSIVVPDKNKKMGDVVLGFTDLAGYTAKTNTSYFGATIGRYANRIAAGTFTLDGKTYHIPKNENGVNMLHGGNIGFDKVVWDVGPADQTSLTLNHLSADGDQGFPGNLNVTVKFTVTDKNELRIDYSATTDKDTVVNLTNHSYFNLSGPGSGTVLDDKLMIDADKYTPVKADLIPTGAIDAVAGTPFDFRKLTAVGARIRNKNEQLQRANGYDQNFVLN